MKYSVRDIESKRRALHSSRTNMIGDPEMPFEGVEVAMNDDISPKKQESKRKKWICVGLLLAIVTITAIVTLHIYDQNNENNDNSLLSNHKDENNFETSISPESTTSPIIIQSPITAPTRAPKAISFMPSKDTLTNGEADTTRDPTDSPSVEPTLPSNTKSPTDSTSARPSITNFGTMVPTGKPSMGFFAPIDSPTSSPIKDATTDSPIVNIETSYPSVAPVSLTKSPSTQNPTRKPTPFPTTQRPTTPSPSHYNDDGFAQVTVIKSNDRLNVGDFITSSSGEYQVGLTANGNFVFRGVQDGTIYWHANISGGYRCYMQGDGNLIIRNVNGKGLWSSKTSKNYGATLVLDDSGLLGVVHEGSYLWIHGVPRGTYDHNQGSLYGDMTFPIRGAFYYPWFPETWTVKSGAWAKFEPDLGFYNSYDPTVVEKHIDYMDYGNIDLGIISWWGPSSNNDRARMTLLMNSTIALKSSLKWTVYYEEMDDIKSEDMVREDLEYLTKWYAWHPTWAHINGKPVIFVYHNKGCEHAERWMAASKGKWHVVLKLFHGFEDCPVQPSSWHQYGPARATLSYDGHSYSISPGFWHANEDEPRLPRLNETEWCQNVEDMVSSGDPWQLVTTFNEAGEGTIIEPSTNWTSNSGYGYYLDCLHDYY
jgi:hypothetical protein